MTAESRRPFPDIPDEIRTIHIIGVVGTAMGSLAAMLKERGYEVRGSDAMAYPPMSTWLADRGIEVMKPYAAENLDWNPDLVIVGNVCRAVYPDAVAMRERGLPHMSLPEALRHFFMSSGHNLVVTGTHGKTTTTSMLAWLMTHADRDPSFMVGGITGNFGSNFRLGESPTFVIEGDEYDTAYFDKVPKFWHYAPRRATINNIEFDHADIYPDIDAIEHVFRRFVDLIEPEGTLWINGDDERCDAVSAHCRGTRRTFGFGEHNTLRGANITLDGEGQRIDVTLDGESLGNFFLPLIGEFNVRNMLGALALALDEGVEVDVLRDGIKQFKPTKKRQELIGIVNDIYVYDDFAHHPTAVFETVSAVRRQFEGRRLWAIFEAKSNTSRRRVFQDAYPKGLGLADRVILSKPWRKDEGLAPELLLDIDELANTIASMGPQTDLIADVDDIVEVVARDAEPGDVIVGLSGSAFGGLHPKIVAALQKKYEE